MSRWMTDGGTSIAASAVILPPETGPRSEAQPSLENQSMDLLLVEDSPTDRLVMQNKLRHAFPDLSVAIAGESYEFNEHLRRENVDVVVTDYWLGWGDGLSVLQRARKRWPRCKVIFLTGNGGEEVVAEAFKFGLFYYLLKPDGFDEFVPAIKMALDAKHREDQHELIESMVESLSEAIYVMDTTGKILTWNSGAERLFHYSAAEIMGKNGELLVPTNLRAEAGRMHLRAISGEHLGPIETVRLLSDGSRVAVAISIAPVRIDTRAVRAVAVLAREHSAERDRASANGENCRENSRSRQLAASARRR